MFNFNAYTAIPTEYLVSLLKTAKAEQYAIEDELYRRTAMETAQ